MKSIEDNALVAVLDDEEAETEAKKLIAQLLPGERARLAKAAGASRGYAKPSNLDQRKTKLIINSSPTPGQRKAGLMFTILSGVLFLLSIYLASRALNLTREGIVATGTIVAVDKRRPTVRLPTLDGRYFTFVGSQSFTPFGYEVGENIQVVFQREQPESAEVSGRQWDGPVIVVILAIGFAYFGLAGLRGKLVVGPLKQGRINIGAG